MCRILAMRKHCGPKNPIGRTTGASRAPPSWLVSIRTTAAESATDHVRERHQCRRAGWRRACRYRPTVAALARVPQGDEGGVPRESSGLADVRQVQLCVGGPIGPIRRSLDRRGSCERWASRHQGGTCNGRAMAGLGDCCDRDGEDRSNGLSGYRSSGEVTRRSSPCGSGGR